MHQKVDLFPAVMIGWDASDTVGPPPDDERFWFVELKDEHRGMLPRTLHACLLPMNTFDPRKHSSFGESFQDDSYVSHLRDGAKWLGEDAICPEILRCAYGLLRARPNQSGIIRELQMHGYDFSNIAGVARIATMLRSIESGPAVETASEWPWSTQADMFTELAEYRRTSDGRLEDLNYVVMMDRRACANIHRSSGEFNVTRGDLKPPPQVVEVNFEGGGPNWVYITFTSPNSRYEIHASGLWDPFVDLAVWARNVATEALPTRMDFDEEGPETELLAYPIGHPDHCGIRLTGMYEEEGWVDQPPSEWIVDRHAFTHSLRSSFREFLSTSFSPWNWYVTMRAMMPSHGETPHRVLNHPWMKEGIDEPK